MERNTQRHPPSSIALSRVKRKIALEVESGWQDEKKKDETDGRGTMNEESKKKMKEKTFSENVILISFLSHLTAARKNFISA